MHRRLFLQTAAAGATAVSIGRAALSAGKRPKPLRILILGGTRFVGIHLTQIAIERGHTVTLFNRGQTNPELFPNVEKLRGDRDAQLDSLKGRQWDAVIDDSGYVPRHVRLSAVLLAPNIRRYLYISSISAYASFAAPSDETSPLVTLADESVEKVDNETYGGLKALCERALRSEVGDGATIVRPGYIVGPEDTTDRFTYYPARAARGGEMAAPGAPRDNVQFIDARDLARFMLQILERNIAGTFNVLAPPGMFTTGDLIGASVESANALAKPIPPPKPVWIPARFLEQQQNLSIYTDFPIWAPPTGETAGLAQISAARALKAGLRITPIATTVSETLAWHLQRPEAERTTLKAGLQPDQEKALLTAWHAASHS